jgi:hypothetical protein
MCKTIPLPADNLRLPWIGADRQLLQANATAFDEEVETF